MDPIICSINFYWFNECSIYKTKKDMKKQNKANTPAFSKHYNFIFWSTSLQISFYFTLKAIVRGISGVCSMQENSMYADLLETPSIHLSLKRLLINFQGFGFTLPKDPQKFSSKISNFILFFKQSKHLSRTLI